MTKQKSDLDTLVTLYQADAVSYTEVYERLQFVIRKMAREEAAAVVRLRPYLDMEDYASIIRVALWKALKGWVPGKAPFYPYFLAAARRELRSAIKYETAQRREGNYNNLPLNPEIAGGTVLAEPRSELARVEFQDSFGRLPLSPNERTICVGVMAGYSQREIARRNGWSEQYVSMTLRRMREKFRAGK